VRTLTWCCGGAIGSWMFNASEGVA
jgi:hypothetical protein